MTNNSNDEWGGKGHYAFFIDSWNVRMKRMKVRGVKISLSRSLFDNRFPIVLSRKRADIIPNIIFINFLLMLVFMKPALMVVTNSINKFMIIEAVS